MSQDNIEQVIGFDLGHGETALARSSTRGNAEPEILEINRQRSQITAIAYDPRVGIVIGEIAYGMPGVTEFTIRFKNKPSEATDEQRLNTQKFVEVLYQQLKAENQIKGEKNEHFFIGCPSGWSDKERLEYEKLFKSAGIPLLTVVRESRAALLHVKESGKFTVEELQQAILVVDIGSSTTDLTLVQGITDKPFDLGYDLGASVIDKAILTRTLTRHEHKEELENIFNEHPSYRNKCEIRCRKAKEEYFSYPAHYEAPETEVSVGYEKIKTKKTIRFEPLLNGLIMQEILDHLLINGRRFIENFRDIITMANNKMDQAGIKPGVVLLTGGPSRMEFIKETCETIFPESRCFRDTEPELTIARGLARWGRVYIRTESFVREVNEVINRDLDSIIKKDISTFIESLTETLTDGLINNMMRRGMRDWREKRVLTLNDLEDHMKGLAIKWIRSAKAKKEISRCVSDWVKSLYKKLDVKLKPISRKYGIEDNVLALEVDYHTYAFDDFMDDFSFQDDITGLEDLGALISLVTGIVITIISGGTGYALIMAGPVGLFIGAGIGIAALFGGFEVVTKIVRTSNIYGWIRKRLSDEKITNTCEEKKPELKQGIQEMLENEPQLNNDIPQKIKQLIAINVREQADKARLLID
jgi:hypothetical protein